MDAILRNFGKPGGFDRNCRNVNEMGADVTSWVKTICALLDLSYWYRGWTFQEACAIELVFLHYGQTRCRVRNWRSLYDILFKQPILPTWLSARRITRTMSEFGHWVLSVVSSHIELLKDTFAKDVFPTVANLDSEVVFQWLRNDLWMFARPNRRTTDPRDQVYSQLGCMPSQCLLNMIPDYTLTTE
jgi:hypothetical protein